MIAKLKGMVDSTGDGWAIIDVGGVGYLVFCSGRTLGRLGAEDAVELMIETHVREDHIHLYGFSDAAERDWFRLLTTVQGVGVKVALGMLSVLGPDAFLHAGSTQAKPLTTPAPGFSPFDATPFFSELKDTFCAIAHPLPAPGDSGPPPGWSSGGPHS